MLPTDPIPTAIRPTITVLRTSILFGGIAWTYEGGTFDVGTGSVGVGGMDR
jgi:hypothetical protein